MNKPIVFDTHCNKCTRLDNFLHEVKEKHPEYHCRPVAAFGAKNPKLLIVGLAPGMHGANQTGRPFTGDHAGILLYQAIFKAGFSNQPESVHAKDDLELINCRITNAVKCLPPANKPTTEEIRVCNQYLSEEIRALDQDSVILALGKIAHEAVLRAHGMKLSALKFSHGACYDLPEGRQLIDSYHCSRYNTQTKRLTEPMFHTIFHKINHMLNK